MAVEITAPLGDPEINQLLFGPLPKAEASHGMVDLKGLKTFATMLPANSSLRNLIMREPDYLPKEEALAKMEVFSQLLQWELTGR